MLYSPALSFALVSRFSFALIAPVSRPMRTPSGASMEVSVE